MESQPQNPEFRINPENFHPCKLSALSMFITTILVILSAQCGPRHQAYGRLIKCPVLCTH